MKWDEFVLDPRTTEDLRAQLAELAASYTPEWRFDPDDPDIGSTLALIFLNQMAGNLRRLNQTIEKYHTEFVNMLGISLLPAYPASGIVTAQLIRETVPGVALPRGTRLLGRLEGEDSVIFETMGDVYVTSAHLSDVVAISGRFGKIIPLLGGPKQAEFLPRRSTPQAEEGPEQQMPAISLFDFSAPGVSQNALLMYHKSVFDVGGSAGIDVRIIAADQAGDAQLFADPERYRWSYYDGDGLAPFQVTGRPDGVHLERDGESRTVLLDGEDYHLICLQQLQCGVGSVELTKLEVSSACTDAQPDFVSHNDQELDPRQFLPFGESASLFDECYIGQDRIFSQEGALITLRFHLSFQEKLVTFTAQQEADELKIIKRKPRTVPFETARTSPQQITLEYFNGIGWKRLVCLKDWSNLFDGEHPGEVELSFRCPEDWQPTAVSGYDTRSIRLRLTRADNCYLQPCIHTMPVVEQLRLSYSYDQDWSVPQRLRRVRGTVLEDLTRLVQDEKPIPVFQGLNYSGNALYLGFSGPMEGAPISILFDVVENIHFESAPIAFEYSSPSGWRSLKVIDNTNNMSGAGTVVFMPPSDFAPMSVEGVTRWWLRLVDERRAFDDQARYHAAIRSILLNAVEIRNVETRNEEAFYVRTASANMSFPLSEENILSADVFVSEKNILSQAAMQQLIQKRPEDVRVTYDFLGGVRSFFVRWTEVENFDQSGPEDRHYVIDRMNNRILFGDGVHVKIPPAQNDVAFTVQVQCCRGAKGNLPAGAVDTLFDRVLYLDQVSNPIATFAGSDIESVESAHRRGANMVSGRGRLVSELDYVREVSAFSSSIEKVKCVAGLDLDGREAPNVVTVAVMMRDYADGAYSFNSVKDRLRRRLLDRSEATVDDGCLILAEPVYVEISLDIWATTGDAQRSFDVQNLIREQVEAFLDPLGRDGGPGWEIGHLPTEGQIRMMLRSIQGMLHISRFIATARYVDRTGRHEVTLDDLPRNPFAIAVSGEHRIYIELPQS